MTTEELINLIEQQLFEQESPEASSPQLPAVISIPEPAFWSITQEQAEMIAARFGQFVFLQLPPTEVRFFEWLKRTAPEVWEDLWAMDLPNDAANTLYQVGVGLLPQLVYEGRGFPICDLTTQANYFFSIKHFNAEEIKPMIDAILQHVEDKRELTLKETFLLEIRRAPMDVWRFAFMYRVPVEAVQAIVFDLVADGLLRYAGTREEMSEFLEW